MACFFPLRFLAGAVLAGGVLASSFPALAGKVFRDDFSSTKSGWADNREAVALGKSRGLGIYDDNGHFQLTPLESNIMGLMPSPRQAEGGDVSLRSTMYLFVSTGRGGAGLFCRAQDHDNFYAFMVTNAGGWSIVRAQKGKGEVLASGALPEQIVPDTVDGVLGAECSGDTLKLTFNGKTMGSAKDSALNEGASGLFIIGTDLAGTYAQYDDFMLEAL